MDVENLGRRPSQEQEDKPSTVEIMFAKLPTGKLTEEFRRLEPAKQQLLLGLLKLFVFMEEQHLLFTSQKEAEKTIPQHREWYAAGGYTSKLDQPFVRFLDNKRRNGILDLSSLSPTEQASLARCYRKHIKQEYIPNLKKWGENAVAHLCLTPKPFRALVKFNSIETIQQLELNLVNLTSLRGIGRGYAAEILAAWEVFKDLRGNKSS